MPEEIKPRCLGAGVEDGVMGAYDLVSPILRKFCKGIGGLFRIPTSHEVGVGYRKCHRSAEMPAEPAVAVGIYQIRKVRVQLAEVGPVIPGLMLRPFFVGNAAPRTHGLMSQVNSAAGIVWKNIALRIMEKVATGDDGQNPHKSACLDQRFKAEAASPCRIILLCGLIGHRAGIVKIFLPFTQHSAPPAILSQRPRGQDPRACPCDRLRQYNGLHLARGRSG